MRDAVIAVPRPVLHLEGDRLHCADGPAVHWPDGARYFFWRGVQVSSEIVLYPDRITVPCIDGERNAEVRRVLIERYGVSRFLVDGGAVVKQRDETGVLYWRDVAHDEPLVMVKVRNSTPEPDGSVKDYFIRVPPTMRTAREAVAWTFGQKPDEYQPAIET
jgi:hypothetical protein